MDSPQHLQARLALCQPEHTVLDLFMQSLLESIATLTGAPLEGAAPRQGPAPRNAPPFRPARDYMEALHRGASALTATGLPYGDAVEKVSLHAANLIFSAPMGEMVLSVAGKDPNEGLSLTQGMAGATSNFGEREYERVSDRSARLTFRDEYFGPAWTRAMTLAGLRKANPGLDFQVELESGEPPYASFTLLVKW
ncbi:TIGR02265 family protein [Pyxidicoccus fallax]|uniref:TIGR02265 family protein n=1 Tax=Pyxidicoccus fallax TaxID=394095 RepID=A0A848LJF0_9BACT|nr:DUF2378 family protein [Pyxidicoccus fallax]NMO17849.1 TIGR02265 family protein [Pyxidicoccus fallax]NPC81381.1 TIGR02265 family protein [Pyxidicoccus fallax]